MNAVWDFLLWTMPWWVQVLIMALIVGVPTFLVAAMIFGVKEASRWVLHAVAVLITLGLASKLRQEGYAARKAAEDRARREAEEKAAEERDRVKTLPDDKLDEEVDKWSRH